MYVLLIGPVGITDGSAVLIVSNVNCTVKLCSVSDAVGKVCDSLAPDCDPASVSLLITLLLLPSPQFQVHCTVAPLISVLVALF